MVDWKKRATLLTLACDMTKDGTAVGKETIRRSRKTHKVLRELEGKGFRVAIIVAAGKNPTASPEQKFSLAQLMRNFFTFILRINSIMIHTPSNLGWGTKAELESAFNYRKRLSVHFGYDALKEPLHVVTSWYHVPRVWMLARWGLKERIVIHASSGSPITALAEIWKIPGEFLRLKFPGFSRLLKWARGRG